MKTSKDNNALLYRKHVEAEKTRCGGEARETRVTYPDGGGGGSGGRGGEEEEAMMGAFNDDEDLILIR